MQAYAHILQAIADGEQIEMLDYYPEDSTQPGWVKKSSTEVLQAIVNRKAPNYFRIASNEKTMNVSVPEFPEPERNALEVGTEYYVPNLFTGGLEDCFIWSADEYDKRSLERGLVHLTKSAAILHAKTCLCLSDLHYCKTTLPTYKH